MIFHKAKIVTALSGLLFASFIISDHVFAKVFPIPLEYLVIKSDYIVIGKISNVRVIEGLRVAEVEVIQTIKGDHSFKKLFYLAEGTWTCDISTAEEGEKALLFLSELPDSIAYMLEGEKSLIKVKELTGSSHFFQLSHSGRGRMPVRKVKDKEYLKIWTDDVKLPSSIITIPGPEPDHSSFIRSAPYNELLYFLKNNSKEIKSTTIKVTSISKSDIIFKKKITIDFKDGRYLLKYSCKEKDINADYCGCKFIEKEVEEDKVDFFVKIIETNEWYKIDENKCENNLIEIEIIYLKNFPRKITTCEEKASINLKSYEGIFNIDCKKKN